ncbi:hypothetical protein HQ571_02065 [Candidatus Kuenenbacteria bacterium]|nr:hypothetical protein [Candidatus Kuenenbacteria bacterium]
MEINKETMKVEEINLIKDFKIALKDMEPYVKDPNFLIKGKPFVNFSLRPREAWANWLLCVVLRQLNGERITFAEDPYGDGFIVDKNTGRIIQTEHVSALENLFDELPKGEARIIKRINLKIEKGNEYAKNKWLVVFFDGAGIVYRNKIRENIKGRHNFEVVYCIGLLTSDKSGYSYAITEFKDSHGDKSISFKVEINNDFTDWEVSQIIE